MRDRVMRRMVLLVSAGVLMGAVHPEAILKSTQSSVEAGQALPLVGEKFDGGMTVNLVLLGALTEYTLGDVTADDAGTFTLDLSIPANVRPGQYQLIALADDGDRAAVMDVSILAAASDTSNEAPDGEGEHSEDMREGAGARTDEMPIERSTTGAGWGLIGLLIGLSGGVGVALLRGSAEASS